MTKRLTNLSPLVREIGWTNHLLILSHTESATEREFYLRMNIRERWSKRELERQLHSGLYERFALATPTGKTDEVLATMPEVDARLNAHFKDEYILEFLGLTEKHSERELRKAILANLRDFFLEFGRHLTFVGEEYPLVVDGEEYRVDLLFYHRLLQCLVAVNDSGVQKSLLLHCGSRDYRTPNAMPRRSGFEGRQVLARIRRQDAIQTFLFF